MDTIREKLENLIDLKELGDKLDIDRIKERIDLRELGSRFDLDKLTDVLNERKSKKATNTLLFVLAIVGAVAVAAGIAFLIYRYLTPAYTDEFDEDFEDFEEGDD